MDNKLKYLISLCSITFVLTSASAQSIDFIAIGKDHYYLQTGPDEVVFREAAFFAVVYDVSGGTLVDPVVYRVGNEERRDTLVHHPEDNEWLVDVRFDTKEALEEAYPPGRYRLTAMFHPDGGGTPIPIELEVPLEGDVFASAPRLLNWAELQDIDTAQAVNLALNKADSGTLDSFTSVFVELLKDGEHFRNIAEYDLLESDTVEIPPGTLTGLPEDTYLIEIMRPVLIVPFTEDGPLGAEFVSAHISITETYINRDYLGNRLTTFLGDLSRRDWQRYESNWYGAFRVDSFAGSSAAFQHAEHGWHSVYATDTPGSVWIYDYTLQSWLWTGPFHYPYIWSPEFGWAYYQRGGTPANRWFFFYEAGFGSGWRQVQDTFWRSQ